MSGKRMTNRELVDAVVDRIADLEAKQPSPVVPEGLTTASHSMRPVHFSRYPDLPSPHQCGFLLRVIAETLRCT